MYKAKIDEYFQQNSQAMLKSIASLISIDSVRTPEKPGKPFGDGPAQALETALEIGKSLGFNTRNVDNYAGVIETGGEAKLAILAHLDVVETGDGWDSDPFQMRTHGGKIYGRGVSDDKGPAMAALYAMAAAKHIVPGLEGVRLVLGCAEETGSECMAYYRKKEALPGAVFSPDADFPVINIEKGGYAPSFSKSWEEEKALPRIRSLEGGKTPNVVPGKASALVEGLSAEQIEKVAQGLNTGAKYELSQEGEAVRILCLGKTAHASLPEEGINAQTALIRLLASLPLADSDASRTIKSLDALFPHGDVAGKALGIAQGDDISGALTLAFSVARLDDRGISCIFDSRVPICGNRENVALPAAKALEARGFTVTGDMRPPHHTPKESPFVQTLLAAYEDYTGQKGECIAIGGGTYVHDVEGGVAFGCTFPGTDTHMHGANESIPIDELIMSAKIFTKVILDMCAR